ncbi:MAG: DUF3784 domain-containing protein [Alistipes sp.]|nr:DUF3784 domain-containing protein [Alistipes sp.]
MSADFLTLTIIASLILIAGIVVLIGKGDWLISGYNTAAAEKRKQYNITRLRLLIGVLCIYVAAILFATALEPKVEGLLSIVIVPPTLIVVILANTWAKRPKR